MKSERWQTLDGIFHEARRRPTAARAAFVAEACRDDEGLRAEVVSLLEASDASGAFMEEPAIEKLARLVAVGGWRLRPGVTVGAYTVTRLLGSGGHGEVWRARDQRLNRDVAIKVLLPHRSDDPHSASRFMDEARTAGALNHANLLAIHDVGEHDGMPYLVSECLDGQSLRQRLGAGPMRVGEAVRIARGIATGLSAAHQRGIVHRDLKPENVFLRSDGGIKILDFGLAGLRVAHRRPGDARGGRTSALAGTAGYMAPEQLAGEDVDARADLFALGVVMFEMLTGTHPFRGASAFGTLQATLTAEPPSLTNDTGPIPARLERMVRRLLEKSPGARFQSASDLAWALEQGLPAEASGSPGVSPARGPRPWAGWVAGGVLGAAAAVALLGAPRPDPIGGVGPVTRFTWSLPEGAGLDSAPVVSPDGRHVAFTATDAAGSRLYVRGLDSLDARSVAGSEGARQPFWSPDGEWVGFFARRRLLKVPVAGGAPLTVVEDLRSAGAVASRRRERGGAWSASGQIVYGADHGEPALSRVSAEGGGVTAATRLAPERGESRHGLPSFLPDGSHFLFFVGAETEDRRGVYLASLGEPPQTPQRRLLQSEAEALYVPLPRRDRGVLLYVAHGRVQAVGFDPSRRELVGHPRALPLEAPGPTVYHSSLLGASSDVLAYAASPIVTGARISRVAEDGSGLTVVSDSALQQWPRVSRDGRRLAFLEIDPRVPNADIWVEDLERQTRVRVTTATGRDLMHAWSPDGSRLVYRSEPADPRLLHVVDADGSGASETVACPRPYCEPTDWSSDGRVVIANVFTGEDVDVWSVGLTDEEASRPLLSEPYPERDARLSPDRRWLAYVSEETGRPEVSVRSQLGRPQRYAISGEGGDQPVWHPGGGAVYFVDTRGRLRRVAVREVDGELRLGQPEELAIPPIGSGHASTQYDVDADGRIYLLQPRPDESRPTEIRIVLGWRALLPDELAR